jgi:hypothetical protein
MFYHLQDQIMYRAHKVNDFKYDIRLSESQRAFVLHHFLCLTPYFSNDTVGVVEVDGTLPSCNILHTPLFSDTVS